MVKRRFLKPKTSILFYLNCANIDITARYKIAVTVPAFSLPFSALCAAFATDAALGHWHSKGCDHVISELQQCCIAATVECWPASLSLSSRLLHAVEGGKGLLMAAPESQFSAVAKAAAGLQLQVAGMFGHPYLSADYRGDRNNYAAGAAFHPLPFLNIAPFPLRPAASRTFLLLDCGVHFNDGARTVAPHMPLIMVEAITKVI